MEATKTSNTEQDTQKELLQLQTSVEEEQSREGSSEEIIQRETVEGTPFQVINLNNEGWFLALGKYRMTEPQENKQELIDRVKNKDWNVILDTIAILTMRQE